MIIKTNYMEKSNIYTKTGDKGTTSLVGGTRVAKSHVRLEAYGTIDELNSFIGLLDCSLTEEEDKKIIAFIQHKLFNVGSYLATETEAMPPKDASIIHDKDIQLLEDHMDKIDSKLPKINKFILPGGAESSSRANICRTVCRRAERRIYDVKAEFPVEDNVTKFVNRLSDYFFLLGRKENTRTGKEIFWDQTL